VLERLTPSSRSLKQETKHKNRFYEESSLPEEFRSRNSHYHRSGFDKGHLAAAADFQGKEQRDSYNLINAAPQNAMMNRSIWAKLERWCRIIAEKEPRYETLVVSGPLWLPSYPIGEKKFQYAYPALGSPPSLVSVPTHFFKVVVVVGDTKIKKFSCFVVPNSDKDIKQDLTSYLVRWTDIEAVSGLELFPTSVSSEWKAMADSVADAQRGSSRNTSGMKLLESNSKTCKRVVRCEAVHLCSQYSCN